MKGTLLSRTVSGAVFGILFGHQSLQPLLWAQPFCSDRSPTDSDRLDIVTWPNNFDACDAGAIHAVILLCHEPGIIDEPVVPQMGGHAPGGGAREWILKRIWRQAEVSRAGPACRCESFETEEMWTEEIARFLQEPTGRHVQLRSAQCFAIAKRNHELRRAGAYRLDERFRQRIIEKQPERWQTACGS